MSEVVVDRLSEQTGVSRTDAGTLIQDSVTPCTEVITTALQGERQGVASVLNDVTREFGTALGVALLGAVLTTGYRSAIDSRLDGVPDGTAATARE